MKRDMDVAIANLTSVMATEMVKSNKAWGDFQTSSVLHTKSGNERTRCGREHRMSSHYLPRIRVRKNETSDTSNNEMETGHT